MKYLKLFENFNAFNPEDISDLFLEIVDKFDIPEMTSEEIMNKTIDESIDKYYNIFKNIHGDYVIDVKCGIDNVSNFLKELEKFKLRLEKFDMYTIIHDYPNAPDNFKIGISNNPESKTIKEALLTYNLENLFKQVELYKVADGIYCVVIESQQLRAFTFLRLQEYYESSSNEFQGNKFTWDRYIQWYKSSEGPTGEKDVFTYGSDWSGFNIPSESIEKCMEEVDDPNRYDDLMVSIITEIKERENDKYYIIGVDELDVNSDLLDHELAHGFYYTDKEYRTKMNNLVNSLPKEEKKAISDVIIGIGYNESVLNDEIQAYMSTGIIDRMPKSLSNYTEKFEKVFKEAKQRHHATPQKIELTYLND
jgi:hypothetical protein